MVKGKIKFQIDPIKELDTLKKAVQNRILRKAIRAASGILRDDLKASVPVKTGALRTSISTKIGTTRRKDVYGLVGPRSKYQKVVKGRTYRPAWYASLLNWGTKYIRPRQVIIKSWYRKREACMVLMVKVARQEIQKTLRK